jgi:hypothetical protein
MSTESLKEEDCETVAENTDSVASDIYLLKDPPVKDEDEQANSDSLDAGSDDLDSAKQQIQRRTRCRHRCCGLAVVFAIVVGIFVVAAVVVVVTLSVTSLQHLSQEPSGWEETVPTTEPSRPVVRISVPNGCFVSVIGTVEKGMHVYKVNTAQYCQYSYISC